MKPNTSIASLDLYAKVEDLLGVEEVAPHLYAHYLLFLQTVEFDTLLDVGCGSGTFLLQMKQALSIPLAQGIDLSPLMVEKSLAQGVDAKVMNLCDIAKSYHVITAVFDMLNYLDPTVLKTFLECVYERLEEGGLFLCDINTLYGFENVAVGAFIVDDDIRFLSIDSDFEDQTYNALFTLFEKEKSHFNKSQHNITQYYYTIEEIVKNSGLTLIHEEEVNLYGLEASDKHFIVLQKPTHSKGLT